MDLYCGRSGIGVEHINGPLLWGSGIGVEHINGPLLWEEWDRGGTHKWTFTVGGVG